MADSLTDAMRQNRLTVVEVDKAAGRLRVRSAEEACSDLSCRDAVILTDEGQSWDLEVINPGDIITFDETGAPRQIVVVRRMYEEYSSPET